MGNRRTIAALLGVAAGAAAQYFLDPVQGRRRRMQTKDQVLARVRRIEDRTRKTSRRVQDRAVGLAHEAVRTEDDLWPENDQVLIDKVRSDILGAEEWRPYAINVDTARGVVTLRGQVDRPDQINALEGAVLKVAGVIEVENLLHLPNTPPRNIRTARASSEAARRAGGTAIE